MAYNTQDAVNTILRLKGNWLNANAEGDTKKTAQIANEAQNYYGQMRENGDTKLADTLYNSGYDASKKYVNDYFAQSGKSAIRLECKPKLILAGASAYPRIIDFKKFADIASEVGAYFMVDMAHIAGLVAAGCHPSPMPYADVVTTTTHKTLRGPRGGLILTNNEEIAVKINKAIFPGIQGGPLMHTIAAKAVCFKEAYFKVQHIYSNLTDGR